MKKLKLFKIVLLAALLSMSVFSLAMADAESVYKILGWYKLDKVKGYEGANSGDIDEHYAGVFKMEDQDDKENKVGAYCTDLQNFSYKNHFYKPSTDYSMACEVLWIINDNTYGPKLSGMDILKSRTGQAAVWYYSDDFTTTAPSNVENATNNLIAEAEQKAGDWCRGLVDFKVLFGHLSGDDYVIATDSGQSGLSFDIYDGDNKAQTVTTNSDGEVYFTQSGDPLKAVLKFEQQYGAVLVHAGGDDGELADPENYQKLVMPDEAGYVDIVFHPQEPTAVDLESFSVTEASPGRAQVSWVTSSETDNAGFNIYRSTSADGSWEKVNGALIEPEVDGQYQYFDAPGQGTFFYMLEDLDTHGYSTLHDPVSVKLNPAKQPPANRPVPPGNS